MKKKTALRVASLAAIVFGVEWAIMLVLPDVQTAGLIDAAVLTLVLAPAIYVLVLAPLARSEEALAETNRDLEARVAARTAELVRAQTEFRRMVEGLGPGLFYYRHDPRGVFQFVSPTITDVLGYEAAEFLNHYTTYLTDDPANQEAARRTEASIRGERQPPYEVSIYHKDGSVRWLEVTEMPVRDEGGRVVMVEGFAFDVTERRRTADALGHSAEFQRTITRVQSFALEDRPLPQVLEDSLRAILDLSWLSVSKKGAIFLVDEPSGKLRLTASIGLAPEHMSRCATIAFGECLCGRTASSGGEVLFAEHVDDRHEIRYGEIADHGHYCVPITYAGRTLGVLCCYVEAGHGYQAREEEALRLFSRTLAGTVVRHGTVVERERFRLQLAQAQKLETVGLLAGGIAHDFNNLLTALAAQVEEARAEVRSRGAAPLPIHGEMDQLVARASRLVRQLLAFSRRQVLKFDPVDLNDVVARVARMLERLVGEHVAIELDLGGDLPPVRADISQIEQVLTNLAVNARDAMPGGGRLVLETRGVDLDGADRHGVFDLSAGRYARLRVTDTGVGMDPETSARIFEPFFTTKKEGEGTGLGLAVVYGVVRQHRGSIRCASEPGRGTSFEILLPGCEERPGAAPAAAAGEPPRGTETILVAEDEAAVARGLKRLLERLGYKVVMTADGVEALEAYQARQAEIDLVILDAVMPRMGGRVTAEMIRAIRSDQPILFSSGYSADSGLTDAIAVGAETHFLQKPYTLVELARAVRRAIEG